MRYLIVFILFLFSLNTNSQVVRLKVNFIQNDSCTYLKCDSVFKLSKVDSLVYNNQYVSSIDIIIDNVITYNVYCGDPERPFVASCYADSIFFFEDYEVKHALTYCFRQKNIAYEGW